MLNEDAIFEWVNPRKIKWTIYGSYVQFAVIFIYMFLLEVGINIKNFNPKIIIAWGIIMSFLSIYNTKSKYGKLDVALSVEPLYCPDCTHNRVAMIPIKYQCPECKSTFNKK